jgi:hypothetical protein
MYIHGGRSVVTNITIIFNINMSLATISLSFKSALITSALLLVMMGGVFMASVNPVHAQTTAADLQAMITQLMAQIAAMTGGNTSQAEYLAGDKIITTSVVRVRAVGSLNGVVLGSQNNGSVGIVVAGPVFASNNTWYRVNFDVGIDGWVSSDWIKRNSSVRPLITSDVISFVKTAPGNDNIMEPGLEDASIASVTVAPATFERYANKVILQFTPATNNGENLPWTAFEEISLWANGWNVKTIQAGDERMWRKIGSSYEITAYTGNDKIKPNRAYNFTVALTSDEDAPVGDRWTVRVPANGVVIWSQNNGHMTNATAMPEYLIKFSGDVAGKSSAKINSFNATPKTVSENTPVTLSWVSTAVSSCFIVDLVNGVNLVQGDLGSRGTIKVYPQEKYTAGIDVKYKLVCQDAGTAKDSVIEAIATVSLGSRMVLPSVKPTPRFNGLGGMTTETITVSAVFGKPLRGGAVVAGPVRLGTVDWGNGVSAPVSALVTGEQMTVALKHTYTSSGNYTITLTDIAGKSVSEKVEVAVTAGDAPVLSPTTEKPPMVNRLDCNRKVTTKVEAGKLACYGMWDFGNNLGGDKFMCGGYKGQTGCKIKTPICSSGSAVASRYMSNSKLTGAALTSVSRHLRVQPTTVTKGVIGLWWYSCVDDVATTPVAQIDSFTATPNKAPSDVSVTLTWKSTNTEQCKIVSTAVSQTGTGPEVIVNNQVSTQGSIQVVTNWLGTYKTNYTLQCVEKGTGKKMSKTVVVSEQVPTISYSSTGQVLGVSTNLYSTISATLSEIAKYLTSK